MVAPENAEYDSMAEWMAGLGLADANLCNRASEVVDYAFKHRTYAIDDHSEIGARREA